MKIGLATIHNVHTRPLRSASYIYDALVRKLSVEHLAPEYARRPSAGRTYRFLHRKLASAPRYSAIEEGYAEAVSTLIPTRECDLLLGIFASGIIPSLKLPEGMPLVHISDTTSSGIYEVGSSYASCNKGQFRHRFELEQRAYERIDLALFPSEWAARSAIEVFGADPERVHVLEWGGTHEHGLESPPERTSDPEERIELLFIGSAWKRKGLDRVIAAADMLRRRGRRVRVTTIGCRVPRRFRSAMVCELGFLDLDRSGDHQRFQDAMRTADCLVHPARSECYGNVLVEAGARGLPVICTRVGGMPTIIQDRVNGLLLDPEVTVEGFVERILEIKDDPELASQLSRNAHAQWLHRLSWKAWTRRFIGLVTPLVESYRYQKNSPFRSTDTDSGPKRAEVQVT